MKTEEIMYQVSVLDCNFIDQGEQLKVTNANSLSNDLIEAIRENKQVILTILQNDFLAKQYGLIIGIPGELYMKTVNYSTTVYIENIGGLWVASRQGSYSNGGSSYKEISKNADLLKVLKKVKDYFDYLELKRVR